MPETKKRKRGCENCRARHVKCDGALPCSQCARRNLTCNKPSRARFRLMSEGSHFPSDQTWCRTIAKKIDFVDQTLEVARQYDGGSDEETDERVVLIGGSENHSDSLPSTVEARHHRNTCLHSTSVPLPDAVISHISPQSGSDGNQPHLATTRQSKPLELPKASLKEREKGHLIRHFVRVVGPSFDFYEEGRRVAAELTERAISCQPLLHLLYTVSAKSLGVGLHLDSATESLSDFETMKYADENNHAAAVLLSRFIFNVEDGTQESTQSIANFDMSASTPPLPGDFRDAILWASLRQEVFFALMNQRHVNVAVDRHALESLIQHPLMQIADDRTWCNRILLHLFDTIQYCFGDARSSSTYDQLLSYATTWMASKPPSFTPVYSKDGHNEIFPEIWFLGSCAAAGMQYYHLVRILLTAHNPRIPRIGSARKAATEWIDERIRGHVKMVCGIAESLEEVNPGHLSACMAIALGGDYFHQKQEQEVLSNVMAKTTSHYGWSKRLV